jgi:diguanylate cyclase (GGDEF)-like protein
MAEVTAIGSAPRAVTPVDAWSRRRVWLLVAAILAAIGIVVTTFAAIAVAHAHDANERKAMERSAAAIAASLQVAIQHQNDLVVSASGFLVANPASTQQAFLSWTQAVQLFQRYPAIQAVGSVQIVPAADVAAFASRVAVTPAGGAPTGTPFAIVPAGVRPFYCLTPVGLARSSQIVASPPGFDFCAGPSGALLLQSRDSGQGAYVPYSADNRTLLAIQTPFYNGGAIPSSIAQRRLNFGGWVATEVDPKLLLQQALTGYPQLSASMRYHSATSDVTFSSSVIVAGKQAVTVDLGNGWTVQTFGQLGSGGLFSDRTALELLVLGIALSLLLGILVLVLGTGRQRARRLAGERSGQLHHQALHDALTGLPNRVLITDRIEQLLARNRRHGTVGAAFYIDIDDFKNVNDTLGHQAGDRLLTAVATRFEDTLRDADTIGRMGGDEFVVLIDGVALQVAPELVAQRLLDVMRQPFELPGVAMPLAVSISIGIAIGDRPGPDEMLRDADVALYQAKAAGKSRYAVFRADMQTEIIRRIDLEFDLRSALLDGQLRLVYQPIYNLDDLVVVGVEALLRWQHPAKGLISPDEFIPILEQSGHIREVGRWVLQRACQQMAEWHAMGNELNISVNVSGRQLDDEEVVNDVRDALLGSGLDATSLIIEVTETALMRNTEHTARRLRAIKELGVRIAIDDFGTGYSSLAYLQQFPVDCLKIDRMFTSAITSSPESRALIGTLVQLGKDLGLSTLAEGVETTDEMELLRRANVDQAQGFLLARPLDPSSLEAQVLRPIRDVTQPSR